MKRIYWFLTLVIIIGAVLGYQQLSSGVQKKSESESGRSGRSGRSSIVPVTVADVVQKNMPVQLTAVGTVETFSTVSIRPQIIGTITQVHFKEGQDVKKGDKLFTIDPRAFEAGLKQAEATLAKDLALLENARAQARRYAELVQKEYVSREQFDQIQASANALEATVEADRASVENAKVQLSYCHIYSPVDGRTGDLLVDEGNLVRTNDATSLVTINQIVPIYVAFSLPEQHLPDIKRRMAETKLKVQASIPGAEDRAEEGILTFVDNTVDRTTGTIRLKGSFANANRGLWPGQFVKVTLVFSSQLDAIVVPSHAVQTGQDGQHVFVLKEDSTVDFRPVIVNRAVGGESIVEKGLQPGEKVVTDGQFLLGHGSKVQLKGDKEVVKEDKEGKKEGRKRKKEKEVAS
jgi:multidrug efflux system membrane fusion protein